MSRRIFKVLYVSHDGDINGGAGLALIDLLKTLDKKKIEPIVLIPKGTSELKKYLKKNGIKYITCNYTWWAFVDRKRLTNNIYNYIRILIYQFISYIEILKLSKYIRKMNIDIIHSNSSVINVGAMLSRKLSIPHIWHIREFGEEHLNLKYLYGPRKSRVKMYNNASTLIVVSDTLKQKYLKYISEDKVMRIYDGVSDKYDNFIEHRSKEHINILITGAIQVGKGQSEAVEACIKLIKYGADINLYVAGKIVDEKYYKEIVNLINKNEENKRIIFLGLCKDMNKLRSRMDIELVCSKDEAFGRVTIEAMLSNLPIIASESGANIELVIDGVNGLLYNNSVDDLGRKIYYLYNNYNLRRKFGSCGYDIAKKEYMQKNNTNEIEKLYYDLIKREGTI